MDQGAQLFLTKGDVAQYTEQRSGRSPVTTLTADESKEPFDLLWPTNQMHSVLMRPVSQPLVRQIGQSGPIMSPVNTRTYLYGMQQNHATEPNTHTRPQITVIPRLEANTRAAKLLHDDVGEFWLQLITPGTVVASTTVVDVVDGNHRVAAAAMLGMDVMRVTLLRPRTPSNVLVHTCAQFV